MNPHYAFNRLLNAIDPFARSIGQYSAYTMENEYIATYEGSVSEAAAYLRRNGYSDHYLAAAKRLRGDVDHGSFRRIPCEHPDDIVSPITDVPPVRCQYHYHLFPNEGETEIHGHYELAPWPIPKGGENVRQAIRRARQHYRPPDGYYLKRVKDPLLF